MPFPSVLNTFNRPAATDRLNSPAHATLHNTVSSAVGQIEQLIGLSTTSVVGSFFYDIRSPDSNGGGHVQTANKGGTGQTTFLKGDLLVATSASVVAKLAVGADNQIIKADSSVAAGIKWADDSNPKIHASVLSSIISTDTVAESSIFSISIPGSVLGTNNVVRATVNVLDMMFQDATSSVMLRGIYGGARVASILFYSAAAGTGAGLAGQIKFDLFGNGLVNAQSGDLSVNLAKNLANESSVRGVFKVQTGVASVASGAAQILGITSKYSTDNSGGIRMGGVIIEKI